MQHYASIIAQFPSRNATFVTNRKAAKEKIEWLKGKGITPDLIGISYHINSCLFAIVPDSCLTQQERNAHSPYKSSSKEQTIALAKQHGFKEKFPYSTWEEVEAEIQK